MLNLHWRGRLSVRATPWTSSWVEAHTGATDVFVNIIIIIIFLIIFIIIIIILLQEQTGVAVFFFVSAGIKMAIFKCTLINRVIIIIISIIITIINNQIPLMQLTLHGQSNDIGNPLALGVCNTASVVSGVLAFHALYLYYCICLPICVCIWLQMRVFPALAFN